MQEQKESRADRRRRLTAREREQQAPIEASHRRVPFAPFVLIGVGLILATVAGTVGATMLTPNSSGDVSTIAATPATITTPTRTPLQSIPVRRPVRPTRPLLEESGPTSDDLDDLRREIEGIRRDSLDRPTFPAFATPDTSQIEDDIRAIQDCQDAIADYSRALEDYLSGYGTIEPSDSRVQSYCR